MNNPTELEVCKAMAELEGYQAKITAPYKDDYKVVIAKGYQKPNGGGGLWGSVYNPTTDKALNVDLRDKYEVEVDYHCNVVLIYSREVTNKVLSSVSFKDKSRINMAICLAILKSKGVGL